MKIKVEEIKLLEVFKAIVKMTICVVFGASCFILAFNIIGALFKLTKLLWGV